MQVTKYNPFQELARIQKDLETSWDKNWTNYPSTYLTNTLDMYEENGALITEVALPHFNKNEIGLHAEPGLLEIVASHDDTHEKKSKRQYHLRESVDKFYRRVSIPTEADTEKVQASFKNGLLHISIPIDEKRKKSKHIPIAG